MSAAGAAWRGVTAPRLRLLADDLTGALDTAAEFVGLAGPVRACWDPDAALPSCAALDLGTRELGEAEVRRIAAGAAPALAGAAIAFKKLDSLLRGHTLPELAAVYAAGGWRRAVLAPAFPFQGRTTRGGRQHAGGVPVGPDLVAALRGLGLPARRAEPGGALAGGVSVFDAETDAGLDAVVAAVGRDAPVLWCGTGGLARALAGPAPPPLPPLPRPVLGLFGSDQAATAAQLAACAPHWEALPHWEAPAHGEAAAALAGRMERHGIALASLDLPHGTARAEAARRIGAALAALARAVPRPGTLAVAGGETLRGLCTALGADGLLVRGRAVPGVPVSTILGGAWDGVTVLSKSGAFGHPALLRELLLPVPDRPTERTSA